MLCDVDSGSGVDLFVSAKEGTFFFSILIYMVQHATTMSDRDGTALYN